MIHGYHVVWGTYGFWLPNDPRGSWSEFVRQSNKNLPARGAGCTRLDGMEEKAEASLRYPVVSLTGLHAAAVGTGLRKGVEKCNLEIWACSILPQHIHLVIGRHPYKVEQVCNLLKGEATKAVKAKQIHPQATAIRSDGKLPSMWAEGQWKVYLENEESIEAAIRYVEENPLKEG